MKTVSDLLERFESLKPIKANSSKSVLLTDGIEVCYSIKPVFGMHDMAFQAVVYIKRNGNVAFTWGCVNEDENKVVVKWFSKKNGECFKAEEQQRYADEKFISSFLK